nr:retrovirus-related Pol polyprotein from transposon TNT 1-94 [Tanacetum cinerariifolium]
LKNVEVKIDDEDAAFILLVSLPLSFEKFMNSFVVVKDTITLEDVRSSLHSRELRHQASRTSKSQPIGLSVTGQDRGTHRTQKEKGKGVLDSKGFKYTSENGVLRISKGALVVMKETKGTSSLYTLQGETIIGSASVSFSEKSNSDLTMLWHMRLGHMSEKGMVILSKRELLDNHKVANLEFCEHCVIEKQKRVSFSKTIHQIKATLDYLHADCWGPSRVPSFGGARYFLSIIDDFSRMTWVFMMKHTSEAFEKFKHWKILIENKTGRKIKRLRCHTPKIW